MYRATRHRCGDVLRSKSHNYFGCNTLISDQTIVAEEETRLRISEIKKKVKINNYFLFNMV